MKTLEKNFKKVRYVGWERSTSPIVEREKKTMQYSVWWDKDNQRGGFEILDDETYGDDYYAEGGLEFTDKVLEVINCLEDWGADVKQMKEDLEL